MGERLLCKQEVIGSIPFTSTIGRLRHRASSPRRGCGRATFGEAVFKGPRRGVAGLGGAGAGAMIEG
jgi:hypothetical protein